MDVVHCPMDVVHLSKTHHYLLLNLWVAPVSDVVIVACSDIFTVDSLFKAPGVHAAGDDQVGLLLKNCSGCELRSF